MQVLNQAPIAPYTTYQIGGTFERIVFPETREDFQQLPELIGDKPVLWMGGGANILFGDDHFDAVLINLTHWHGIEQEHTEGECKLATFRAGTQLPEFVNWVRDHQVADFDYLAGIPGTVGGAVFMNAGAWRRYIEGQIVGAELYDLTQNSFLPLRRDDLLFEYRRQKFLLPGQIVVSATLDVSKYDPEIGHKIDHIIEQRCLKHPTEPSCGSVFKNPMDIPPYKPAGYLIESCGLKGQKLGGAQISPKHANFIVNTGGAKFTDVLGLIHQAQEAVSEKFGIQLEPEVRIVESPQHEVFFRL